jgi:hypothetical protein
MCVKDILMLLSNIIERKKMAASGKKVIEPHKIFNSTARALIRQLDKVFPHEVKLGILRDELERYSAKDCENPHVPAMMFYKSMELGTGIFSLPRGEEEDEEREIQIGEMILNHDARLFSDECKASIQALEALDLKTKWKLLDAENRNIMWDYLERLAKKSSEVAAHARAPELDSIVERIKKMADALPPGLSEDEKTRRILANPELADVASSMQKMLVSDAPSALSLLTQHAHRGPKGKKEKR